MKKRVFAFLIVFLLALSVLQIRAPIALGYTYDVTLNALRPSSGQKGDYVTINFSGSVYNVTAGAPVSYKSVSVTAYCFTTTVNTTVQTNGSGYFSGSISGTLDSTGSVEAYYSGYSDSQTFHVTSALSVSLSASSPDAVTNQPVTFTASASGGSGTKTYSWTGLGSGSANGSSATGKWSSSGNKTVKVTVTDSSGSASATKTISVHNLTASISGPTSGNTNTNYTFSCSASGSSGYSYSWSGGGSPSTGSGSSFTTEWSSSGNKTVSCTVTDSYGNSVRPTHTISITAQNNLSLSISASPSTTVQSGTQVTLTAYVSGGQSPYSYSWSGGGVSGTSSSVSHTWTNTGSSNATYTVSCTVTDYNNNSKTSYITITVTPANNASIDSFTASPYSDANSPLSPGTNVTLSWSTTNISNVYLYEGNSYKGTYSGNSSTTVAPATTVTYTIKDANNTSISKSLTVYVANSGDYTVTETLNPTAGTAGQSVTLEVSGTIQKGSALNTSTVNITIDATSLGFGSHTVSATSRYDYTFPAHTLPSTAGTYAVKVYLGSTEKNSQNFTVNVQKKNTVLTLSPSTVNITAGNNTTITATLKDSDGNPVSGVSLDVSPNSSYVDAYAQSYTNSNGQSTIQINVDSSCPAGSYPVTVKFDGNSGYNNSSAQATVNVAEPTTLGSVVITPKSKTIEGGTSIDLSAKAYDTNNNDITNQVTFNWSKSPNKGTLNVLYSGAPSATYTADIDSYTETITVQGSLNGVTKSDNATITVTNTALVASMQNKISDIETGQSHTFSVKVTYGTQDVTNSSTITWSANPNVGTFSSTSGASVTWTAPSVTGNTDVQIKVHVQYTDSNNVTKTADDFDNLTVKALQQYNLVVANAGDPSTPASDTTGTLYYDDVSGNTQSVSVQGDGTSHSYYANNAHLTLTVTNPFVFDSQNHWRSKAPHEYNCDKLTGQTISDTQSTYTYDNLTGNQTITASYFRKLHIRGSISKSADGKTITVSYSAFGGPYPSIVSNTVDISKIELHIYNGDNNPAGSWTMQPDTVTLNGSSKSQSVSVDQLGLAPGTYKVYPKITGNIDQWAANGDTYDPGGTGAAGTYVEITVSGSLYVSNAMPTNVHTNTSSDPYKNKTDILIESLDASGNPVKMSQPTVAVDGGGHIKIWSENADGIHWHADWYPGESDGSKDGTTHTLTINGKVKRNVTVYSGNVPPPYTITIQGFSIQSIDVDTTTDPQHYVYITAHMRMSVVTWYSGSDDNSTDPGLEHNSNITITSDMIDKEDSGATIGSAKLSGQADEKGLYSSGSDPGYANYYDVPGAIPISDLTGASGQSANGQTQKKENSVQLLSVKPITGGVNITLKVNGTTVTRTIIINGSATRGDAKWVQDTYGGKVSATDQATDQKSVNIDVPSSTGTVIVHKTVQYGDGTTEPLQGVSFTLTDADGNTHTDTTDSNGNITFANIPVGNATITETVPSGYTNDNPTQTVTVQKDQSVEADFVNTPVGATIHIHKYNDDNGNGKEDPGEAASGITFDITSPNGGSYTVTTDSNGDAYQKVTVADTYTITEHVPDGYAAEKNPQQVTITKDDLTSGATKTVVFVDIKSNATIIVKKFKDDNGNGVWDNGESGMPGVSFSISNSEYSYSGTTDSTGTYKQTVVPGTYTVTETVPSGYTAEPSASQTVTVNAGETQTVTFGNKPIDKKAYIKIFKFYDADGNGSYDPGAGDTPMSGVTFNLSGPETQSGSTDSQGYLVFTVTHTGTYTVTEQTPNGYTAENGTQSVTIAQSDLDSKNTKNLSFANKKQHYEIDVFKFKDDNGNGVKDSGETWMSGVTFTCQNNNVSMTATTNSNGEAVFTLPNTGTYTITEQVPSGYKVTTNGGNSSVIVNITDNSPTQSVTFGDQPVSATLKIFVWNDANGNGQIDNGENGVGNVTVSVAGVNYQTDSAGYIYIAIKKAGSYTANETVPAGWTATTPTSQTVTFTDSDISSNTTKEADFGIKTDTGTLTIHKFIDYNDNGTQDSGEPNQADVPFYVIKSDNTYKQTFTTDSNGNISVAVPVGDYTVTEQTPSGYTAETPQQTVTINKGDSKTLVFANYPKGCAISIHKFVDYNGNDNQDSGEPDQSGVQFTITDPNGNTSTVVTDNSGNAVYTAHYIGTYTITETVPDGYTAENPQQSVYVSGDDLLGATKSLTFANKPSAKTLVINKFIDYNGNGQKDSGDGPQEGVEFTVTGPNNFSKTVTTDGSGQASVVLTAGNGTYTITETVPANYQATTQNPQTINVTDSSPQTINVYFGNKPVGEATIHIYKFIDHNGDGVENGTDGPLSGVKFDLYLGSTEVASGTTDSNGIVDFKVKTAGTYTVKENPSTRYTAETPQQDVTITQTDIQNAKVFNLKFANKPKGAATIHIHKFIDYNKNGTQDNGEPDQSNVTFVATGPNGFSQTVTTNSNGDAYVTNIKDPGTYTVTESVPSGYTAENGTQTVSFTQSDIDNFAEKELIFANESTGKAKIHIHKFIDLNGNGQQDQYDENQANVSFTVTGPNNFSQTVQTDSSGNADVEVSTPGTYTVTESVPNNFTSSTGSSKQVSFTQTEINNQVTKNLLFGNKPVTYCVSHGDIEPPNVIVYTEPSDEYNKIVITAYIGNASDWLHYPGATSVDIYIPKEDGMKAGLRASMYPVGDPDPASSYHEWTYTWYDVEDPDTVPDGTVRDVYITFHNAIFGDIAVHCPLTLQYTVKNPNHHVGGSSINPQPVLLSVGHDEVLVLPPRLMFARWFCRCYKRLQ